MKTRNENSIRTNNQHYKLNIKKKQEKRILTKAANEKLEKDTCNYANLNATTRWMTLYKRLTPCKTVSVISKHYTTATTTFKREPNTKRKDRAKLNNVYHNKETKKGR